MANKTNCKLVVDCREKLIIRHEKELEYVNLEIKQITIGDYAVVSPMGSILAIIERKSFADFAASLKDGRANNKSKLIALREQCGCRILYIIEGPAFPGPNDCYGNIPYRYIESSIFHLMIRDQISIIYTKDTLGTAKMLHRFMLSMDTLCDKMEEPDGKLCESENIPIADIISNISAVDTVDAAVQILTAKHEKSTHDIVREMWSVFPGIATETASDFIKKWTLADIVMDKVSKEDISTHKIGNKTVNKKVINSLTDINLIIQKKLLCAIPGISVATASSIISSTPLSRLLTYTIDCIAIIGIGKPQKNGTRRKLGVKLAEKIIKYFNYKYENVEKTEKIITADDPDILALLGEM